MVTIGLVIAGGSIMCLLGHSVKNSTLPKRRETKKTAYFFSSSDKNYKGFDWESLLSTQNKNADK